LVRTRLDQGSQSYSYSNSQSDFGTKGRTSDSRRDETHCGTVIRTAYATANAISDAGPEIKTSTKTHFNTNAHIDTDSNVNADANGYTNIDTNAHTAANTNANAIAVTNLNPIANPHTITQSAFLVTKPHSNRADAWAIAIVDNCADRTTSRQSTGNRSGSKASDD
jgi:hypothetical protein